MLIQTTTTTVFSCWKDVLRDFDPKEYLIITDREMPLEEFNQHIIDFQRGRKAMVSMKANVISNWLMDTGAAEHLVSSVDVSNV